MYDALTEAIALAFGESEDGRQKAVVPDLRLAVAQQEEAARQAALKQEELRTQQENEQKAEEELQLREEQRQQEEARSAQAREEAELARRAREARAAREETERRAQEQERRMREKAERVDREWMDSIAKGPDGVREQLQKLRERTPSGETHQTALNALHTLFSQIVSHPEEPTFRRVRRDHARFHEEIGQYPGGRELLIAAGFRLGAIDDVPCFISTEPDIEKEMDAWSEWFDLLKATLNLLEQEMLK
jgi:DNA repair exonuclease SbcCD ATPase subunit